MLIALFADIHANREALSSCLLDAEEAGADRLVFLGDLVGYGPDPEWVIEKVAGLVAAGAVAVKGNHDAAVAGEPFHMNPIATAAIRWTREEVGVSHKAFLADLPLDLNEDDRLYVHSSACSPQDWIYLTGAREAFNSFRSTAQRLTFCGHTHVPALFNESATSMPIHHVPVSNRPVPLLAQRRWIAVIGSVGQPRDHDPAACYGLLDTVANRLTYKRVPYDADVTARKVKAAGLPDALARRLVTGS